MIDSNFSSEVAAEEKPGSTIAKNIIHISVLHFVGSLVQLHVKAPRHQNKYGLKRYRGIECKSPRGDG